MQQTADRNWIVGAALIAIGALLLAGQWFDLSGALVLGVLSIMFIGLYAATRAYGLLIPGCILGGLAFGVGFESAGVSLHGGVVVLGLAAGFVAIYVVNVLVDRAPHWWPLIPGTILGAVGLSTALEDSELARLGTVLWPVLLIAAGLVVLLVNLRSPAVKT